MIRCSSCSSSSLRQRATNDHDVGPLFGLDEVRVDGVPAWVCPHCAHVVLEGEVIEGLRHEIALLIVQGSGPLTAKEVRFLRETLGMTQAQLAERLDVIRGTVTRWEAGDEVGPVQSFALRTLAAWALEGGALARAVSAPDAPRFPAQTRPYRISHRRAS
jgi:putative zinc finger/helix-turn-helix YgiT family protein